MFLSSLMATQASGERQTTTVEANFREQEAYTARRAALEADIVQAHPLLTTKFERCDFILSSGKPAAARADFFAPNLAWVVRGMTTTIDQHS